MANEVDRRAHGQRVAHDRTDDGACAHHQWQQVAMRGMGVTLGEPLGYRAWESSNRLSSPNQRHNVPGKPVAFSLSWPQNRSPRITGDRRVSNASYSAQRPVSVSALLLHVMDGRSSPSTRPSHHRSWCVHILVGGSCTRTAVPARACCSACRWTSHGQDDTKTRLAG